MSGRERLLIYLYSRRNIAGSLLAIAGVGAYLLGYINHYWIPIVAGLYGVGALATPSSSAVRLGQPGGDTPEQIASFLDDLVGRIRNRVEPSVLKRVMSIVASINQTLPELARGSVQADGTLFTVRQIAVDYLPNVLETYLKLPASYRTRHAVDRQKTPLDVLQEQLDLLDSKMQEIVVSVHENDVQALLASGRFLKEKFAQPVFRVTAGDGR